MCTARHDRIRWIRTARRGARSCRGGRRVDDMTDPVDVADPVETVRLVVPAEAQYGRVARAAVSSLALRLGVPYRRVEDVRIAVDEAVILLLQLVPMARELVIEIGVSAHRLDVDITVNPEALADADPPAEPGRHDGPDHPADDERLDRFGALVAETVDRFDARTRPGHVHLELAR